MTKSENDYIEHEVKLRVHNALFKHIDYKFSSIEQRLSKLENKFNWVMGIIITSMIIPLFLKHFGI